MKAMVCLLALFAFVVPQVYSQQAVTLKGTIIDNQCAGAQTPQELTEFVKTHTKECALMATCAASGYAIFADGKLQQFDRSSSAKVHDFLKQKDSTLQVEIVATPGDKGLGLVSIKNR